MRLKLMLFCFLFCSGISFSQESILLNMPMDGDTIATKNPLLSWSLWGAIPTNSIRDYYQIIVVELQENQDASSGILMNSPLVRMDHLSQNQLFYPYDAPVLQEGKWYAWEVQKIMDNSLAFKSETYKFYIPILPNEKPLYYKLKHVHDGIIYNLQNGILYFEFDEPYALSELNFKFYNSKHIPISKNIIFNSEDGQYAQEINVKKTGSNYYKMVVGSNLQPGVYELEVENSKKQKYVLKFKL